MLLKHPADALGYLGAVEELLHSWRECLKVEEEFLNIGQTLEHSMKVTIY
jgi:hypothetical protein